MDNQSKVARLRAQIEREHKAMCWARDGLAIGTAQHRFITRRQSRIDAHYAALKQAVGEQRSTEIVLQIYNDGEPLQRTGQL